MANSYPYDHRRERRLRQKRQAARRRRRLFLGILGILLAGGLIAAGVVLIPRLLPESPATQPSTSPSTAPMEPETVITLAAAGDLNITDRVIAAGQVAGRFSYTDCFLDVAALFARPTASLLNFEGNFRGAPYGTEKASAPRELAQALQSMGVDLVQLANSYTIYNGLDGLSQTIQTLQAEGLEPLGAFPSPQAAEECGGFTLKNIGGIRVALVAFTKGVGSMGLPAGRENQVNLLYKDYASTYQEVDTEGIQRILKNVQAQKPDITIALLHWGSEYNDEISDSQAEIAQLMLENGVDAILGTHSHYVQQVAFDETTGQLVAYSLGDFLGDGTRAGTNYSIVLQLEITRNNLTGQTRITGWDYEPIFIINEADSPLRVVRIREAMRLYENHHISRVSQETYEAMKNALSRIEARIQGSEK